MKSRGKLTICLSKQIIAYFIKSGTIKKSNTILHKHTEP